MPESTSETTSPATNAARSGTRLIEIGIVVAATDGSAMATVRCAQAALQEQLEARFPDFAWRFSLHSDPRVQDVAHPSALLQRAAEERDLNRWDFALLVTRADLLAHYRPFALSALSRPLDAAVLSLARLGPSEEESDNVLVDRLATLMIHAIGHLSGLDANPDPENLMYRPSQPEELERMRQVDESQLAGWRTHLEDIADQRLEEASDRPHRLLFPIKAAWINRTEILEAIGAARPWQFPYRLSRLTTAAVSTVAVLLMTAEAWDLGLSLRPAQLGGLAATALLVTTTFVVMRQQLLLRRSAGQSEQAVVTSVSAVTIVLIGLGTTWLAMMLVAIAGGLLLFGPTLITGWAPATLSDPAQVNALIYLRMSAFVSSVAILIGALGASFEDQSYFRHVIFVDEEI